MLNTASVDTKLRLVALSTTRVAKYVRAMFQLVQRVLAQVVDWILGRQARREILLISSDRGWAQLLKDALGARVRVIMVNRTQAQAFLERDRYDLVLVDVSESLAGATKAEEAKDQVFLNLVSAARRQQGDKGIVLVVGEAPTWRPVRDAFRRGAADFVGKPIDAKELRKTFGEWLPKGRWPRFNRRRTNRRTR